jgi:lysophospholipase L1-like esterase
MYKYLIVAAIAVFCGLTPAPSGEIKWVAIGDSITYLNDHPDETGYRVKKGYMTRVADALTGVTYVNKGYNGWTTGGIADRIDGLGLEKADVYSVFLGTNDWWQGRSVGTMGDYENNTGSGTVYGAFRIIIDKLKELNANAPILLITPLQRGDFVYINDFRNNAHGSYRERKGQQLSDVARAIQHIARKEKLELIDLYHKSGIRQKNIVRFKWLKDPDTGRYKAYRYPGYKDIPFDPANAEYPYPPEAAGMTYDGLHPSDKGNEIIARMIARTMKSLLHGSHH